MSHINNYVASYSFEDKLATTVVLDAKEGANGTASKNTVVLSALGKSGNAFYFNGTSTDYITIGNPASLQISDNISINAVIRTEKILGTEGAHACIINKKNNSSPYNGFFLSLLKSGDYSYPAFSVGGLNTRNAIQGSTAVNDNKWHNITGVMGTISGWQIDNAAAAVIPSGAAGRYVENIVYDPVTEKYWWIMQDMNQTGAGTPYVNLASADTIDGAWTIQETGIILGYAPHLALFDGVWYIYYKASDSDLYCISSETVNSGYGAAKKVLAKGDNGSFDYNRVDEPYVFLRNGVYHMLYMGGDVSSDTKEFEKVGLATCATPDGTFVKVSTEPIMSGNDTPGSWNSGFDRAADPYAFQLDATSDTWYVGVAACVSGKANWRTGYFRTTDFVHFTPVSDANPILHGAEAAAWDGSCTWRGAAIKVGTTWYIAYTGRSTTSATSCGGITTLNINGSSKIMRLYVDGVKVNEWSPPSGVILNNSTTCYITLGSGVIDNRYGGFLDDLKIYNLMLTDEEVEELSRLYLTPDERSGSDILGRFQRFERY